MNKYQEALDGLKENIENITGTRIETDEDFYGWIDTLQELVDKETPKTAIKDEVSKIRYIETYTCPNCGGSFSGRISDYCYHCGQALHWREDNG